MMSNHLHLSCLNEMEVKVRNDVDYWFQVIRAIHTVFPKGYIELPALCFHLYGNRASVVLNRLKLARVDTRTPIDMEWTSEGAPELLNSILFPLAFVAQCISKLTITTFDKAYQRFLTMKEVVD